MSGGEESAIRVPVLSLDRWVCCEVDGCWTRVLPGYLPRCRSHGGDSPAEVPYDPEGNAGITLVDRAAFAWEPWD